MTRRKTHCCNIWSDKRVVCYRARTSVHETDGDTDHKFIKDETINIMIAGRDTVGTATFQPAD